MRQGNSNEEVAIYRYVTEGSFDAYMWQALETKARFIAQVMTGSSTVRQAEDIGGQELSYAEVKAIASGNPAVLTLAEADAELKRLTLLKKHHADEQYLARRHLRELPETIAQLEHRLADLEQDLATASAPTAAPFTIGSRTCSREDALERLATRLEVLPSSVAETRHMPLGTCHGLRFSLVLHPQGAPDVCVEGATTRYNSLSRDSHGPRAILNAVERVMGNYEAEREKTTRDLDIAQGQQRDYHARLGAGFAHERYLEELTGLRDQLETALSGTEQKPDTPVLPTVHELVRRIKALKAAHTIEPAPERSSTRRAATTEAAVTTRIRHRLQDISTPQPETTDADVSPVATHPPMSAPQPVPPPQPALFTTPVPRGSTPKPSYRQRATQDERPAKPQLSLF
jgi:hypothetical protein